MSIKKVGLSSKDINYLFVFKTLRHAEQNGLRVYPALIYQRMKEELGYRDSLDKKRSRSYVYETINEMEQNRWLSHQKHGRKKIYTITAKGADIFQQYFDKYHLAFHQCQLIIDKMINNITFQRFHDELKININHKDQKYLSKLINVREFVTLLILYRLLADNNTNHNGVYGHDLYIEIEHLYSWKMSSSYFYEIVRGLHKNGWIEGFWQDDSRYRRLYFITAHGKENFPIVQHNVLEHLKGVRSFLRSLSSLFHS